MGYLVIRKEFAVFSPQKSGVHKQIGLPGQGGTAGRMNKQQLGYLPKMPI
jgi:hypothetical protein